MSTVRSWQALHDADKLVARRVQLRMIYPEMQQTVLLRIIHYEKSKAERNAGLIHEWSSRHLCQIVSNTAVSETVRSVKWQHIIVYATTQSTL